MASRGRSPGRPKGVSWRAQVLGIPHVIDPLSLLLVTFCVHLPRMQLEAGVHLVINRASGPLRDGKTCK